MTLGNTSDNSFIRRLPAFIQLTRLNRPIGVYLLLWPTIGALWIAAGGLPDLHLLFIFVLGTWVMRSAGCAINDFADKDFDGHVLRTHERPLVTGALSRREAFMTFIVLCLVGLVLLLFTNALTMLWSLGAVAVTALYPFMKRYTHLPQVVLGVAFSWGIPMAFAAQQEQVPPAVWLLVLANLLWTVAYDTEYAMADREYDLKIGVKSTAILFGKADKLIIGLLQALFLLVMVLDGQQFGLGLFFYLGLAGATLFFIYQHYLIREREANNCFKAFLNNHWAGTSIFAGIFLHYLLSA